MPQLGPTVKLLMQVKGIEIEALVDTGCPATIISRQLCQQILDNENGQETQDTLNKGRHSIANHLYLRLRL